MKKLFELNLFITIIRNYGNFLILNVYRELESSWGVTPSNFFSKFTIDTWGILSLFISSTYRDAFGIVKVRNLN